MALYYSLTAVLPPTLPHYTKKHTFNNNPNATCGVQAMATSVHRAWDTSVGFSEWTPPRSTCNHMFGGDRSFCVEQHDFELFPEPMEVPNDFSDGSVGLNYVGFHGNVGYGGDHENDECSTSDGDGDGNDFSSSDDDDDESTLLLPNHAHGLLRQRRNGAHLTTTKNTTIPSIPPNPLTNPIPTPPPAPILAEITGTQLMEKYRKLKPEYAYENGIYSVPPPHYYGPLDYLRYLVVLWVLTGAIVAASIGWLVYGAWVLWEMSGEVTVGVGAVYSTMLCVVVLNCCLPLAFFAIIAILINSP